MYITCRCGEKIELDHPIPDESWITIRESICAPWIRGLVPNEIAWENLREHLGSMVECLKCGRLLWHKPGDGDTWIVYRSEGDLTCQSK